MQVYIHTHWYAVMFPVGIIGDNPGTANDIELNRSVWAFHPMGQHLAAIWEHDGDQSMEASSNGVLLVLIHLWMDFLCNQPALGHFPCSVGPPLTLCLLVYNPI